MGTGNLCQEDRLAPGDVVDIAGGEVFYHCLSGDKTDTVSCRRADCIINEPDPVAGAFEMARVDQIEGDRISNGDDKEGI